jgi:hypothetical protein
MLFLALFAVHIVKKKISLKSVKSVKICEFTWKNVNFFVNLS